MNQCFMIYPRPFPYPCIHPRRKISQLDTYTITTSPHDHVLTPLHQPPALLTNLLLTLRLYSSLALHFLSTPYPCTAKHSKVQILVTIKLVGKTTIPVPDSTYSFSKPAAAKTDASDDFVGGVGVELGRAKRPVRKDVVFVNRVMVRVVPLGPVPERVIVGVRRVRRVALWSY